MKAEVEEARVNREKVVEKKFSDPAFVGNQCSLITDVLVKRDWCMKKFIRHTLALKMI